MYISVFTADSPRELESMVSCIMPKFDAYFSQGSGGLRAVVVYQDANDYKTKIQKLASLIRQNKEHFQPEEGIFFSTGRHTGGKLAVLFPGQGSQYVGMLKTFMKHEVYKNEARRLLALSEFHDLKLSSLVESGNPAILSETSNAQPAIAISSWCLYALLRSMGLSPSYFGGHSFGELVALAAAGAYDPELLLEISIERGRLMSLAGTKTPGKMIAVIDKDNTHYLDLHEKLIGLRLLPDSIELANINTPSQLVYSGPSEDILSLKESLSEKNIKCALLTSSAAFHGKLMKPAADEFESFLRARKDRIKTPYQEVISTRPGSSYESPEDIVLNLSLQLQDQINWVHVIKGLREKGVNIFLEVGPKNVLSKMAQEILPGEDVHILATDGGLSLENILAYLIALGSDLRLENKKELTIELRGATDFKVMQGFISRQKELIARAWEIKSDSLRTKVQQTLLKDSDTVLQRFYSIVESPKEEPIPKCEIERDEVTSTILEELANITGHNVSEISLDANFDNELYLDSITRIELLSSLSSRFKTQVSDFGPLLSANTVKELALAIGINPSHREDISEELLWLRKEIANYTGITEEKITPNSRLSEDLMLDSLFMMDLLGSIQAQWTKLTLNPNDFSNLKTVQDVVAILQKDTSLNYSETKNEKKFHKALKESLAAYLGLSIDKIQSTSDFTHDLKMNVFEKEDFIASLIIKHPYLQMAGRELLHASNVGEVIKIESLFDRRSPARGADGEIRRYTFRKLTLDGATLLGCIPPKELLVINLSDENTKEVVAHLRESNRKARIKMVKGLSIAQINKALKEIDTKKEINVLFLISQNGELEEDIQLSFDLLQTLRNLSGTTKYLSVKMLINNQGSLLWKGLPGLCRAFSKEQNSNFVIIEIPWHKKSPDKIPWTLLWGSKEDSKERCKVYYMEGKNLFREELQYDSLKNDQHILALPQKLHILLVGGARGITAEIAKVFAEHAGAKISALGRTPIGSSMPFETIESDDELREKVRALIEKDHADASEDERLRLFLSKLKSINNEREIWKTRRSIESRGGSFYYYQADATQLADLRLIIKEVEKVAKIDGIIHAAGIIRDALIQYKSLDDYSAVISTKVKSALNIQTIMKSRKDLSFVCFFSSLSSWSGAPGQTDYSLANEIINELTRDWSEKASFPVTSLLWSVWSETGLASEGILSKMSMLNIEGITNRAGVRLFMEELLQNGLPNTKVLLSSESTLKYALENLP